MTTPIQQDKSLSLNTQGNSGASSATERKSGAAATSDGATAATQLTPDSSQVNIDRASQLYASQSRQASETSGQRIDSAEEAITLTERLTAMMKQNPNLALQAQSSQVTDTLSVLLETNPT